MRWFRSNVRSGAWFALVAMAIQLALTFGHLHLRVTSAQQVAKAAVTLPDGSSLPTKPRLADEHCAVCTQIQMAGTGVPAAAASLPIPVRFIAARFSVGIEHDSPSSLPRHFQARGPPIA
jgi:hypothetical protein